MSEYDAIAELAANLACRARLGLTQVAAGPEAVAKLSGGQPQAGDLAGVRRELGDCTRCPLCKSRERIVFGDGPEKARLLVVGGWPSPADDSRGLPFAGPEGRLLERMLAAVGLSRQEAFVTHAVKCLPAGREPSAVEAQTCLPFLRAQATVLRPAAVLALGPLAAGLLAGGDPPDLFSGQPRQLNGMTLLATFDPAHLLQNPADKAGAYRTLKALAQALGVRRAA